MQDVNGNAVAQVVDFDLYLSDAATGIGLLTTDAVVVTPPGTTAGVVQAAAYVSASDTLALQFVNPTAGSLTPPAGTYVVTVFRVQPSWTAPASGNQLDW